MARDIKTTVHVGDGFWICYHMGYLSYIFGKSAKFKCSFAINEAKFFKAFNTILGKVGRNAPEALSALIRSNAYRYCFMALMHVLSTNSTVRRSLEFTLNKL